jgi:hypothetical protein
MIALASAFGGGFLIMAGVWLYRAPIDAFAQSIVQGTKLTEGLEPLSTVVLRNLGQTSAAVAIAGALLVTRRLWTRRAVALALALDYALAAPWALDLGEGALADIQSPLTSMAQGNGGIPVLCQSQSAIDAQSGADAPSNWAGEVRARQIAQPHLQACDGLSRAAPVYSPLASRLSDRFSLTLDNGRLSVAQALGCTHLITPIHPTGPAHFVPVPRYGLENSGDVKVFELDAPIPRAFVAKGPRLYDSEDVVFEAIVHARDGAALLATVDDPVGRLDSATALPRGDGVLDVELSGADWNHQVVRARGSGGGIVGLRTSFQVGWTAEQAGRSLPMVRVAGNLVGAVVDAVDAGEIRFEYKPPRRALSLLGLAVGAAFVVWAGARDRRERRQSKKR